MPLSKPVARKPLHHRIIDCRGYERADGLFDIEGRLTDAKDYGFDTVLRGRLEAGDYIHDMWLRLTLDETFKIHRIEAVSDAHPYPNCSDILPNYEELIGLRITSGFTNKAQAIVGREKGCTHHTGLLRDLATVAFQAMGPILAKRMRKANEASSEIKVSEIGKSKHKAEKKDLFNGRKPPMIDGCHALKSDNPNVKQFFPEWYTGPEEE